MANYLARVAASGAASQPVARPSLIAPPILPGRPPAPEPGETTSPRMGPVVAQPAMPASIAPRPTDRMEPPPAQITTSTEQAPPAVPGEKASEHPVRPASATRAPQPSPLPLSRPIDANVVRAPRIRPPAQEAEAAPPRHFEFRPQPAVIVQLPRALGRAQPAASGKSVTNVSSAGLPSSIAAAAQPAQSAEPVMPAQAAATARPIERSAPQAARDMPAERRIVAVPQIGSGTTVVEMPVAGSARREPKITIGQIDVQVINTPAAAPPQAAPAPAISSVPSVELERVRWRPL